MVKDIVVVGDSLLSVLICRELEKRIGPRVDFKLTLVTRYQDLIDPHLVSTFGRLDKIDKADLIKHGQIQNAEVKSINLKEKRVVTKQGTLDFDYLIIDQSPAISAEQVNSIREQLQTIFAALSAQEKIGKDKLAKVAISGESAIFLQLALAIKRDAIAHRVRRLAIEVFDNSIEDSLGFVKQNGVEVLNKPSETPGFQIHKPLPPVNLQMVKGLKIGEKHPLIDQYHQPLTSSNVLLIREDDLREINLISVTRTMAKRFAWNVLQDLDEEKLGKREADLTKAYMLTGIRQTRLWLDKTASKLVRAALIKSWEHFLWQSLRSRRRS